MSQTASFTLSAFGDEIADDLDAQLAVLRRLQIDHLDLRGVWGKNVLDLNDDDVQRVAAACERNGIAVAAIGSPIGKTPIEAPIETELENLRRIADIAHALKTRSVRIFSFYPPDTSSNAGYDAYVPLAIERIERMLAVAEQEELLLLLENEKEIVGDTVARCHAILQALPDPRLVFVWDPANFVQVGEERVTERGWPLLGQRVGYVHIKDCSLGGEVRAAGEGDGQIPELLQRLRASGYRGILSLEPHLAEAGHSSGFSGPEGMAYAAERLRSLL